MNPFWMLLGAAIGALIGRVITRALTRAEDAQNELHRRKCDWIDANMKRWPTPTESK